MSHTVFDNLNDGERIVRRYDAFWRKDCLDRALLQVTAPRDNASPPDPSDIFPSAPPDRMDWFLNPERVIPRLRRQLACVYYAGDAFPMVTPVNTGLVAIQAAYMGGQYRISGNTAWCDPVIDDWATRPPLSLDEDNPWWRSTKELLAAGAAEFGDSAVICIPDLQGGGQIVDLLRGTERLAMDLLDNPGPIAGILEEIDAAWQYYWTECCRLARSPVNGYADWVGFWCESPAVTVECDFCCMISPEMFRDVFIPSLRRQTAMTEHSIYHLDGPDAIRHLDALLDLPDLDGIQWVPGAGSKTMSEWLPLLRRIQDAGKLLVLRCPVRDAEIILCELRPEGLLVQTSCGNQAEADDFVRRHTP